MKAGEMKAIIVGGGIGGLAAALALGQHGWQVEVLERAAAFGEVGAGLSLWPDALRALDALGVGEAVRGRAALAGQAGIRDAAGRWLARTDTAELERRYGPTAMRTSLWPGTAAPRYAGYTAWRVVTPPVPVGASGESWGAGERFGFVPLPDGRIYCFATANAAAGEDGGGLAGLRRRFGGWHDPIPALLEAASPDAVRHDDLYELPPLPAYTAGPVALVGDAAHAMTPTWVRALARHWRTRWYSASSWTAGPKRASATGSAAMTACGGRAPR